MMRLGNAGSSSQIRLADKAEDMWRPENCQVATGLGVSVKEEH